MWGAIATFVVVVVLVLGAIVTVFFVGTTGRSYETPVVPFPTDEGFVIALPYGPGKRWAPLSDLRPRSA